MLEREAEVSSNLVPVMEISSRGETLKALCWSWCLWLGSILLPSFDANY